MTREDTDLSSQTDMPEERLSRSGLEEATDTPDTSAEDLADASLDALFNEIVQDGAPSEGLGGPDLPVDVTNSPPAANAGPPSDAHALSDELEGPTSEHSDLADELTNVDSLDDEFELLVSDQILLEDDTAAMPSDSPYADAAAPPESVDPDTTELTQEEYASAVAASDAQKQGEEGGEAEPELDENGDPKKGFFKKLFGK
jgi:hypothetical protein